MYLIEPSKYKRYRRLQLKVVALCPLMKLLVLSIVLFVLLQLQCAQGASLAGKLQDDEQQTEDAEDEKELENEDMTNSETQEADKETESLIQIGLHNTTADQEGSSLHESSELEDDLKNKSASQKLNHSSEEEINGKSSKIKSALNDTLKKNETMKRTLQTRLGVGATSALSLGVGGSASINGPSSSTSYAAGADLETGVGMGLNSQQTTATRPSITTSSQTDISTGVQEGSSTSNNLNEDLWPSTQDNLNKNAKGSIQSSQQQTRPATVIDSSASSTSMYNWPTYQSNLNTNPFASSIIQNHQQQTTPSVSPTSQIRPSTAMNPDASSTFNNWSTSQSNLNTNVFVGGSTETSQQQSRPSLTAGSQVGVTTTNHNRPFPASNADAKLTANNWQTVNRGINTNTFAGAGIQNNAQQSGPSMETVSHAGATTNQYSPSTEINANASYVNNWQSMLGGLNANAFAGGSIQTNQQPSRPSLTAGSQVEITAINQNRPTAGSNTNTMPPANTWMTMNGGINTNTLTGGAIQNNQPETRPSQTITANSQVGISNQYMSTANGLSAYLPIQQGAVGYNGQTSGFPSSSHNSETSHQSQSLEPLTKISQLMKVVEVISNDSSVNIPGPLVGDEANVDMNFAQDSNLEQSSFTEGQDVTKLNLQNNNIVQPTNYSKLSLDDLTKIVQLLKVVEVISNATSEEEPQFNPEQNIIRDTDNPAFITYDVDGAMNSGSYLDNGLSVATQGNANSDLALTSRPTSGLGGPVTSHVPNYQNSYINNQVSQNNQLTASAGVNVIGETTSNLYKQFSPELTSSSTTANINFNNVASSEQVLSQGISASSDQNYLAASGNGQAATSASPPSSGIKRRSLTSLVQTVDLLDAIETLANINNTEQKGNKNSEHLTSNTYHPAALQNGATISNNFNSNAVAQINAGFYSPQEMTQESYIDQRPSLAAQGEATQHVETGVNLSNMAEIKPTTTTNNQQNFRPTLSLENSKDTASQSVIPNYQQQTLMGGVAQAGIGNQYRPGSVNENVLTTLSNLPTVSGVINMNNYNSVNQYKQQITPSVATETPTGFGNNQFSSNAASAIIANNSLTTQGGTNQNNQQQIIPSSTAAGTQSGMINNQVTPNLAFNLTTYNLPTTQSAIKINAFDKINQYNQQQIKPSVAAATQSGFGSINQYRPNAALNTSATATVNYPSTMQENIKQNDLGSYNQQQIRPSVAVGTQIGFSSNNQYRPNTPLNTSATATVNYTPAMQDDIKITGLTSLNQYNKQQIRPTVAAESQAGILNNNQSGLSFGLNSTGNAHGALKDRLKVNQSIAANQNNMQLKSPSVAAGTQTGFGSNNQYRPNATLNISATSTANYTPAIQNNIKINGLAGLNLYNEQQIRPTVAAESQAGILNNNQSGLSFGLNTTGNAHGAVKDRLKVNQSIAANQNIMLNSPLVAVESQAGFGSKTQSKPNSVINANATTKLQSALAAGNQNQQKNQTSVKAESQVDLNKTSINNKPQMTQINANSKDNLDQTSTQRFQGGTKINDKKQNADINNQEGTLQTKNSSTATTGNQLITLKTIETKENSGINLNQQHTKQSNAGKTQVGSVSTINQQLPYAAINLSSSTPINNVLIPLINPNVNTYATTNQIQPLAQVPVILNNPSLISESNLNTSSYNSKLNQDSSQNHTSEIIRNQLIHSIPTIQGQLVPSATGLLNNSQPTDDPLINGGPSQQKTTSMNNNQKIAINTLSTGLNVEGGTNVTNTKENNDTDKENSRSLASDVQVGNNSSHHSNSSTAKDSKKSGSTETQSKESEKSKSKIPAQGNTDVGNIKIPANTITKEHKTIGESQNQISATSTAEKSHIITNLTPSIASESNSHVDCIKKEPLSNGSISITNVGDCIMHQNHGNANQLDNMQVSGAASSSSVINGTPLNSSVGVNAIANSKNETNNIVTASSDASFNATNTDKSQVTTSSEATSAQASSKQQNQSQTSTGLSLSVGI